MIYWAMHVLFRPIWGLMKNKLSFSHEAVSKDIFCCLKFDFALTHPLFPKGMPQFEVSWEASFGTALRCTESK